MGSRIKRSVWSSAAIAALGVSLCSKPSYAVAILSVLSDTGTLVTTSYAVPASTSANSVPSPYGSGSLSITPVVTGYKVSLSPTSGFFASANNLSGGKTAIFAGLIAFDIFFDSPVHLTAKISEDGIYSVSGQSSRVGVATPDTAGGIVISQLDNVLAPEKIGNSFNTSAIVSPLPSGVGGTFPSGSGTWSLTDTVSGFSKNYKNYHVVIDNDLIAESLANPNQAPGFAAIAKKDFSITFTFDGSSGGGPIIPEPGTVGMLIIASAATITRRARRRIV